MALKEFLPKIPETLKALEIGTGTGRFALPLAIRFGLEPSRPMAKIAKMRGIETILGVAEFLPFKIHKFDLLLVVTAFSFFQHPVQALGEMFRVLKPGGQLVMGILDRDSPIGHRIELERKSSKFSSKAHFFSATEVLTFLTEIGFEKLEVCQTLFKQPEEIESIELPEKGHGKGGLAVISARKPFQEMENK